MSSLPHVVMAGPAASESLEDCSVTLERDDDLSACTISESDWDSGWGDDSFGAEGFDMGPFIALFVLGVLASVAILIWKVSTARRLAAESGMDRGLATQMVVLTDDGLEATYLAANLRSTAAQASAAQAPAAQASAAQRLAELKELLDAGLINQTEHDERRTKIIDAV